MAQRDMTLTAFFEDVYMPRRMVNAGRGSIQVFEVTINRFAAYLGREPLLSDLDEDTLAGHAADIVRRGLSPNTANLRLRYLAILHRFARKRGYVEGELDLPKLRAPKRLPTAWSVEEVQKIIESARLSHGRYLGVPAGAWWEAFVLVLYDTGIRKAAAFKIRFEEIDFTNKILRVPPERMKNLVEQYFRLHDQTIEAILSTLPPRRELVFPWPFHLGESLYGRYKRILRRAGLPYTSRDLFHRLRRTTATHIARLVGEPLAIQQLGHQDPQTIKRYIDPRFTANHRAALLLERPAWKNPRQLEIEVTAPRDTEPLEIVTKRYSQDDLTGAGDDVFAILNNVPILQATEIIAACKTTNVQYKDLAAACDVTPDWISRVVNGKERASRQLSYKIRRFFGLDGTREVRVEERQVRS